MTNNITFTGAFLNFLIAMKSETQTVSSVLSSPHQQSLPHFCEGSEMRSIGAPTQYDGDAKHQRHTYGCGSVEDKDPYLGEQSLKSHKNIKLILHKLSGSRDKYGTISHDINIPEHYTFIDLARYILSNGLLNDNEGLPNYIEKNGNYMYDFFEDFQDSSVIKNLRTKVPPNSILIFSPNYYNYPKDHRLTLNYVYIRKDMRNMRWKNVKI